MTLKKYHFSQKISRSNRDKMDAKSDRKFIKCIKVAYVMHDRDEMTHRQENNKLNDIFFTHDTDIAFNWLCYGDTN